MDVLKNNVHNWGIQICCGKCPRWKVETVRIILTWNFKRVYADWG